MTKSEDLKCAEYVINAEENNDVRNAKMPSGARLGAVGLTSVSSSLARVCMYVASSPLPSPTEGRGSRDVFTVAVVAEDEDADTNDAAESRLLASAWLFCSARNKATSSADGCSSVAATSSIQ